MTEQNPNPILVAVGYDPMDAALAYAAAEAAREGCGLHLLHVVHPLVQGPEMPLVQGTDLERIGRQTLNAAVERAGDLVGDGIMVTTGLAVGGVVPSIVEATKDDVRMVVMQHRALSRLRRVVTRSVTSGVAAHARVPVVSVPSTWSPESRATRTVTVGVDIPDRSTEVLRAAAHAAATRGAVLRVLHTWSFPSAYDDIILTRTESKEWADRATAEIRTVLDSLGADLAGVPVQIDARHAQAAEALVEASTNSDLLVIGRHDPVVPIGSHLGPVARAVLREAGSPVLLADPRPSRRRRHQHPTETAAAHS